MIISKTPLRICLGGGGSDLPEFYERLGGFVFSAAISKYIYVMVHRPFNDTITLKYSDIEIVQNISDIKHGIIREVLKSVEYSGGIEIASFADLPSRSGLGSSGSFTVGLKSIFMSRYYKDKGSLAESAYDIERNKLKYPIGKQDPYIASYGGLSAFEIETDGNVIVRRVPYSRDLDDNLLLFYTGVQRDANDVLVGQAKSMSDSKSRSNMLRIREIGYSMFEAVESGNITRVGTLFDEHWKYKKKVSNKITNSKFNELYREAKDNGALGGKIVGAGGGGFFLFYVEEKKDKFIQKMENLGLQHIDFCFDIRGNVIL